MRAAGTAAAQTGISSQVDTMKVVRKDTAQSPTGSPQEESPEKGHTPPSATAKSTEIETTTDQTTGTETDRTDTTMTLSIGSWRNSVPAETIGRT